jgi:hypothetical protein
MQPISKRILSGIIMVIAVAFVSVWFLDSRSIPEFNVKPLPQHAPTLNEVDIEKVFGTEHFRVVRRVRQVPVAVKESFSNFTELPFDLVDPGEEISSDDLTGGRSSRRLLFLGLSDDSAVLFYEQGGFAGAFNTVVFWFGDGGRGWGATLQHGPIPKDISSLKVAVQKGMFNIWDHRK